MFQISVYIGAVVVLILFTIMVVPREIWQHRAFRITPEIIAGSIASIMLIGSISLLYLLTPAWSTLPSDSPFDWSVSQIAQSLIIEYGIALQILALVLFAGLLGALTLAKVEPKKEDAK
jgi:NADH-quinone oxidoreductase subunit J